MLFVMMAFSINANTILTELTLEDEFLVDDCFQRAWDYGTSMGNGDSYWTWYYTNKYYSQNCDVEQEQ